MTSILIKYFQWKVELRYKVFCSVIQLFTRNIWYNRQWTCREYFHEIEWTILHMEVIFVSFKSLTGRTFDLKLIMRQRCHSEKVLFKEFMLRSLQITCFSNGMNQRYVLSKIFRFFWLADLMVIDPSVLIYKIVPILW